MKIKGNFIYILIIAFLIILLILGHQINKQNSASKKNEISNIVNQLKTRNNQLAKIQKNLFEDGKNLNEIINKKGITFENIFKGKKKFIPIRPGEPKDSLANISKLKKDLKWRPKISIETGITKLLRN